MMIIKPSGSAANIQTSAVCPFDDTSVVTGIVTMCPLDDTSVVTGIVTMCPFDDTSVVIQKVTVCLSDENDTALSSIVESDSKCLSVSLKKNIFKQHSKNIISRSCFIYDILQLKCKFTGVHICFTFYACVRITDIVMSAYDFICVLRSQTCLLHALKFYGRLQKSVRKSLFKYKGHII